MEFSVSFRGLRAIEGLEDWRKTLKLLAKGYYVRRNCTYFVVSLMDTRKKKNAKNFSLRGIILNWGGRGDCDEDSY